jgi:hypothetical protein
MDAMQSRDLLVDAFGRFRPIVERTIGGLEGAALAFRPGPDANSIAWLIWHLTRVEDDHVSEIAGREQAWTGDGWAQRFGMSPDPANTGYGHTSEQVGAVRPEGPEVLLAYYSAVSDRTLQYLETVDDDDLDRIIDTSYDPPVTVGVRLVSVVGDCLQHAGQAAYVRGLLD